MQLSTCFAGWLCTEKGKLRDKLYLIRLNCYFSPFISINIEIYVLLQDRKKEEKKDQISIEELVEEKRAELSAKTDLTPVTLETFVKWKKRKLREKAEAAKKDASKKKDNLKSGQTSGLSGRELFSYNPNIAKEDVSIDILYSP